jgi:predicted dinucleotide-binding enzyme
MRIGIIGAGHVGSTLAGLFVHAGHDVAIANAHGPATLRDLQTELGPHGHAVTTEEAAFYGDAVVLAVPFGHYRDIPTGGLDGKTVIDAGNYYAERDGHIAVLDDQVTTSSELVQQYFSLTHVVKAFNAMRWDHLRDFGHEGGANHLYGIPVAGDDPVAKTDIFNLIEQVGYEPVDAGDLGDGRKFQPGTDVYDADLWADDLRDLIGVQPT